MLMEILIKLKNKLIDTFKELIKFLEFVEEHRIKSMEKFGRGWM